MAGVNAVRVPNMSTVETDANARVWINFNYTFDKISFSNDDWSSLEGKNSSNSFNS